MLNRIASLAMSTSVLKTLPGKFDIKRHSPSIIVFDKIIAMKTVLYMFVEEVETATGGLNSNSATCPEEQDFNLLAEFVFLVPRDG